jgi:hypothetical protein
MRIKNVCRKVTALLLSVKQKTVGTDDTKNALSLCSCFLGEGVRIPVGISDVD